MRGESLSFIASGREKREADDLCRIRPLEGSQFQPTLIRVQLSELTLDQADGQQIQFPSPRMLLVIDDWHSPKKQSG